MNTTTYYSATKDSNPTPYLGNLVGAVRALLKALFAARVARPAATLQDRVKILRTANAYRCSSPSLSQELTAIAYRDS